MDNKTVLLLNALLYIGTFVIYQIKTKKFTLGSFLLLFYAIISSLSIDLFFRSDALFFYKDRTLTIFPFVYLYVILIMMFTPLLKFSTVKIDSLLLPSQKIIRILSIITIIVSIVFFIVKINGITLSQEGLVKNYFDYREAALEKELEFGFSNFVGFSFNIFGEIAFLLLVYILLYIKNNKFLALGLLICIIINILYQLSRGSRMVLFNLLLDIPFLFFVFRDRMSHKIKYILFSTITIISIFVVFIAMNITIGRFAHRMNPLVSLEDYIAQPFINFNTYGLDAGGTREGDQTSTLFKKLIGMETSKNQYTRRDDYFYLKVDNSIFYTFVGDFTIDYGPYFALIILIILSLLFSIILLTKSHYHFGHLLVLLLLYRICVHGFSLFTYGDIGGNAKLLSIFLFYLFFSKTTKKYADK